MTIDTAPPIRLPVWRLVKASLASVFRYPANFLDRAWPWIAIAAIIGIAAALIVDPSSPKPLDALIFVLALVTVIAAPLMVVVNWHRGLLLGEPGGPRSAFRFDRALWRYVGVLIVIVLLAMASTLPLGIATGIALGVTGPLSGQGEISSIFFVLPLLFSLAVIPVIARSMLALPMAAISAEPPLIRASWRLTAGHTWRLSAAVLIAQVVGMVANLAIELTVVLLGRLLGETTAAAINMPISIGALLIGTTISASLASYAYAVLTNHPLGRDVTAP